jgi:flagellar motor switch protein FliG
MSEVNHQPEKIRLNGKQQVIDMLQLLEVDEKNTLLKNIHTRNPAMAKELLESSFNFKNFMTLSDSAIVRTLSYINSTVLGIALNASPEEFQRRVLRLIDRKKAEETFGVMQRTLGSSARDGHRAQNKIVTICIALSKKRVVSLFD